MKHLILFSLLCFIFSCTEEKKYQYEVDPVGVEMVVAKRPIKNQQQSLFQLPILTSSELPFLNPN